MPARARSSASRNARRATPSGLSSLSRKRPCSSSIAPTCASNAGRPLRSSAAASPCCRAVCAPQAESANTWGSTPSVSPARLPTKATTSARSASVRSRSDLLSTITTFLPHSRIAARNARSLSVNGRSAEETNSTRSARGRKSRVKRLVLPQHGVGARGVDDRDRAQDRQRVLRPRGCRRAAACVRAPARSGGCPRSRSSASRLPRRAASRRGR